MVRLTKKEEKNLERTDFVEYQKYYWMIRNKYERGFINSIKTKTRKKYFPIIYKILKIRNKLLGNKLYMINNITENSNRPKIYTITHIGKLDIEMISEAIKEHFYVLSGDFENLHGTSSGLFLEISGVIYVNEQDKEDRKNVKRKMIETLTSGGNIMYFPEGAWNLSPNLLVLDLFPGIINIARESNALIIPIAVEQYDNKFIGNVGKTIDIKKLENNMSLEQMKILLRDELATLKWEIFEQVPMINRSYMEDDKLEKMINQKMSEWKGFTYEDVQSKVFKDKRIVTSEEAFEHLKHLKPKKENAFLFRK